MGACACMHGHVRMDHTLAIRGRRAAPGASSRPASREGRHGVTRHRAPGKHTVYYDLLDACKKGGCPICALALEAVARYLDATIYERVNDPRTRDAVVRARGYCNDHAWQLTEMRA